MVKNLPSNSGDTSSIPVPGKSHGHRSLVGCSPWGRKQSGTTEQLTLTYLGSTPGLRSINKTPQATEQLSLCPQLERSLSATTKT